MDDLRIAEVDEAIAWAVKRCYDLARGDTAINGKPQDGFAIHGRRQMYWKGRCDVATEIRAAFPEVFKNESIHTSKV